MGNKKGQKTWKKGESGNPKGRPPAIPPDVRDKCREHTLEAIDTLVKIMRDESISPGTRANCANSLLDRGYGKPSQTLNVKRKTTVKELTDNELYAIASGAGTDKPQTSTEQPNKVH